MPDVGVRALDQAAAAVHVGRVQGRQVAAAAAVRPVPVPHTHDRVHCLLDIRRADADRGVRQPDAQPQRAHNAGTGGRAARCRGLRGRRRGRRRRSGRRRSRGRRRDVHDRIVLGHHLVRRRPHPAGRRRERAPGVRRRRRDAGAVRVQVSDNYFFPFFRQYSPFESQPWA